MTHAGAWTAYHTFREIVEQPQAWPAALEAAQREAPRLRELWRSHAGEQVVFTGCGSPYFLARTVATIFRGVTGVAAEAVAASDIVLFPEMALGAERSRLMLVLSRSGATTELLRAVEQYRSHDRGAVAAITCYGDSPLAQLASLSIALPAAQERSLAQTRSFTSMLLAAQCSIFGLAELPLSNALAQLPEHGTALIENHLALASELGADPSFERFVFLGGGPFYGLACEAMLKMKEMSLSTAEAYHVLEYRHGPMSMVDDRTLIVGFLSEAALPHELAVLDEMRALGARVLVLTSAVLPAGRVDYQVRLPAGLTDAERGPLYMPVPQLLAFFRAVSKGLDPDRPANLVPFVRLDFDAVETRWANGMQHLP